VKDGEVWFVGLFFYGYFIRRWNPDQDHVQWHGKRETVKKGPDHRRILYAGPALNRHFKFN